MNSTYTKVFSVAAIVIVFLSLVPLSQTQAESTSDYTVSFLLQNKPDGNKTYELNVTIPMVLNQYYALQSHALYAPSDFKKFITPYTLKPIADRLWQIYDNNEDFTNGVLELVHQITYQEVIPGKYPIETLVAGNGDCDLFAFIAASILQAGGIPVVLIFYKERQHMEIGVDLGSAPTEARVDTYSVKYQNVTYYIGESTGGKWRDGWRIGETPTQYQGISAEVIPLDGSAQSSISQVSASLRELDPSTVTLQANSPIMLENSQITFSGQVLPQVANENVTLQAQINGGGWTTIGTVLTAADGRFAYSWVPPESGAISLQASWEGNRQYNGANSVQQNVFILPYLVVAVITSSVIAVLIVSSAFVVTRRRKPKNRTLQPPTESLQQTMPPEPPTPPAPENSAPPN